jgi:hypothetical protein
MDLDLGVELGAFEGDSNQRLTLYIPNKDRVGREIANVSDWIDEARRLLSQIGGGATAFPPADGTWLDEHGTSIWEQTKIVFCYVYPDRFRSLVPKLREFTHRFGRETNQGEVVVEFDNLFWRIKHFAPPTGG